MKEKLMSYVSVNHEFFLIFPTFLLIYLGTRFSVKIEGAEAEYVFMLKMFYQLVCQI